MWPYYILAFAIGELLLYMRETKTLFLEISIAFAITIAFTALGQHLGLNSGSAANRPLLLAAVNFSSIFMPLAIFVVANQLLIRIKGITLKHVSLMAVTLVTVFFWPAWALYITCASGLDCM